MNALPPQSQEPPRQNIAAPLQGPSPGIAQREQENYYQDWKQNPTHDYQTINASSRSPNDLELLRPQRQQSEQEKKLVGMGYGRSSSINSKSIAQDALDHKYRMKDFSQEDPTGWIDPRAAKLSSVAMQAQGHQLPPRPKPKI